VSDYFSRKNYLRVKQAMSDIHPYTFDLGLTVTRLGLGLS